MNKKSIFTLLPMVVICLLTIAIGAQNKREVLTNAKIIELVQAGFDEDIIVQKIRQSDCQCDTSTDALTKLKVAKVSKPIIMAMLEATSGEKPYSESNSGNGKPVQTIQAEPSTLSQKALSQISEPGIYLFENGEIKQIEPTIYSGTKGSFLGTALTYGIKKSKIRAVIRGKSANLQVKTGRPEFYFVFSREYGNSGAVMSGFAGYAATSPAEFVMIAMRVKGNSREAVLGEIGAFSASTGTPEKDIREFAFEKIKPGVFKVVPKIDLVTGEYCFYYGGASGTATGKVFDFSVTK